MSCRSTVTVLFARAQRSEARRSLGLDQSATLQARDPPRSAEIRRDLPRCGLDQSSTAQECALARNEYTRRRLQRDFHAGLAEMAEQAGERAPSAEALARFELPVFTVSSRDYQAPLTSTDRLLMR